MTTLETIGTVCGVILSLWGVLGIIYKLIQIARKPEREQDERIKKLEDEIKEVQGQQVKIMEYLANDKEHIKSLTEGTAVTQKALLALLGHAIDGNNDQQMRDAREALHNYLLER